MNQNNVRITIRQRLSFAVTALLIAGLALLVSTAYAHGSMEHVTGTLVRVTNDVLSVKTAKGATVDVHVDAKTQYVHEKQQAKKSDLKAGDRVVIHAAKMNGVLVAHEVQFASNTQAASVKAKRVRAAATPR